MGACASALSQLQRRKGALGQQVGLRKPIPDHVAESIEHAALARWELETSSGRKPTTILVLRNLATGVCEQLMDGQPPTDEALWWMLTSLRHDSAVAGVSSSELLATATGPAVARAARFAACMIFGSLVEHIERVVLTAYSRGSPLDALDARIDWTSLASDLLWSAAPDEPPSRQLAVDVGSALQADLRQALASTPDLQTAVVAILSVPLADDRPLEAPEIDGTVVAEPPPAVESHTAVVEGPFVSE